MKYLGVSVKIFAREPKTEQLPMNAEEARITENLAESITDVYESYYDEVSAV